jgi:hypothetical protein
MSFAAAMVYWVIVAIWATVLCSTTLSKVYAAAVAAAD